MTGSALRLARDPQDAGGRTRWTAYADGGGRADGPWGTASLSNPPAAGQEADFDLEVPGLRRRQGVGSALLAAVLAQATELEAASVSVEVPAGGPGEQFLLRRGFAPALALVYLRMNLAASDQGRLRGLAELADRPYHLVFWSGAPPAELADPLAVARSSMTDAPTGQLQRTDFRWDASEVMRVARVVADRGDALHSVAALTLEGMIAGYTEVVVPGGDKEVAQQYDTVVVPEHRGHGLGVLLKANLAIWLRAELPGLRVIETDNAADNHRMQQVNLRLGYHEIRRAAWWNRGILPAPGIVVPA
jgi:GNAT superfamily N-acetyltransferase